MNKKAKLQYGAIIILIAISQGLWTEVQSVSRHLRWDTALGGVFNLGEMANTGAHLRNKLRGIRRLDVNENKENLCWAKQSAGVGLSPEPHRVQIPIRPPAKLGGISSLVLLDSEVKKVFKCFG